MQTLSTHTEVPEFLSSLLTLSEFYGQNTASERRNLRSTIEQQGLAVDTEFLAAASTVIASLDAIEADVGQLSACCRCVGSSLASSKVGTCCSLRRSPPVLIACRGRRKHCFLPTIPWKLCHRKLVQARHYLCAGPHSRHADREQAVARSAGDQRGTLRPGAAVPAAVSAVP